MDIDKFVYDKYSGKEQFKEDMSYIAKSVSSNQNGLKRNDGICRICW